MHLVSYGTLFFGGELLMGTMNQPGCGPCCVSDGTGCHPDITASPCTGERSNPTMTITASATFRWVTSTEVLLRLQLPEGTPLHPDILSAGWYYVQNGSPVPEVPEGDWKNCTTCMNPVVTWNPYDPADGAPNGDASTPGVITEGSCTCANAPNTALGLYDGRGCLKCLPRYRCARIVFTPAPYSEACPSTRNIKMYYSCPYTWTNAELDVTVSVELYRQSTAYDQCECLYRVTVGAGTGSEVYDGIQLDELGLQSYGVSTDEGDYAITIGAANVAPNPLARVACAPCICTTCLPGGLLVTIEGIAACPGARFCASVSLCASGDGSATFALPDGDVTISVSPKPASEGECALNVSIMATFGTLSGDGDQTIYLESIEQPEGQECAPLDRFDCREVPDASNNDQFFTSGVRGVGTCSGWANVTKIDSSFPVLNGGSAAFTVRIRDGACDECPQGSPTCKGACIGLESYGLTCTPPDLTAVIVSECNPVSTTMVPQETAGFISGPHPLQDGTIGTEFCQAFYSGARVSPTQTQPFQEFCCGVGVKRVCHQFYFAMYYNGLPCATVSDEAHPEDYRLAVRFGRTCTTLAEPSVINATVLPTSYSCEPPMWEFHTGITWGDLYGSFAPPFDPSHPCNNYTKCCEDNLTEEIVIRVML